MTRIFLLLMKDAAHLITNKDEHPNFFARYLNVALINTKQHTPETCHIPI
ncbi:hypothetical protein [Crenothrix sp.]